MFSPHIVAEKTKHNHDFMPLHTRWAETSSGNAWKLLKPHPVILQKSLVSSHNMVANEKGVLEEQWTVCLSRSPNPGPKSICLECESLCANPKLLDLQFKL